MAIKLLPLQHNYVYSPSQVTAFLAGRGCGKTFATAYLICNKMTHGKSVLAVAPTYPLLNAVLIKETLDMLRRHNWKFVYNKTDKLLVLHNKNGSELSRCYFRSADCYDTIRGISNVAILVMDEAAYCPREAYEVSIACLRGEHVRNPQVYLVSTPRGKANWFSQVYLSEGITQIHGTSYDNPHNGDGYVDMLKSQYGSDEFIQQEVFGSILDSTSSGLFKSSDFSLLKQTSNCMNDPIVFGFDVGGSGDDKSAISVVIGNRIVEIASMSTPDDKTLIDFVSYMYNKYNPSRITIDATGLGNLLPSRIRPLFTACDIVGVNFAQSPIKQGYNNARSEMYFDLRNKIRANELCFANIDQSKQDMIEMEMLATNYSIDKRHNLAIDDKASVKKEIKRSPDMLDSLALAVYNTQTISQQSINHALKVISTTKKYYNNKKG